MAIAPGRMQGRNRALQGFLERQSREREARLDRELRREEFKARLLENRKQYLIPALMERFEGIAEMAQGTSTRLTKAEGYGFTEESAAYLESTGQLDGVIGRLDKITDNLDRDVSKKSIQRFNEKLSEVVAPEKLSAAVEYADKIGALKRPSLDGFMAVVSASTDEQFAEAMAQLQTPVMPTSPTGSPLDLNLTSFGELTPEKRAAAGRAINRELMPVLGGTINPDTNTVTWSDPENAGRIANNALDYYILLKNDPFYMGDETEIISEIGDRIFEMKRADQSLSEIANNPTFDYSYVPPSTIPRIDDEDDDFSFEESVLPNSR